MIETTSQLEASTSQTSKCTPNEALKMYLASAGFISLALERLQQTYPTLTEVDLYQLLSDPTIQNDLESKTRAQLIMRTFEAANEAIISAKLALPHMEPFEKAKAASQFLAQLDVLTKKPQDININQIVWEQYLPAEAAEAVRFLTNTRSTPIAPDEVINHNPYIETPAED